MKSKSILVVAACIWCAGCAGMSSTEQRMLSGGAIGAGSGALIGAIGGSTALGAAIGGGAGVLGGLVYDQYQKSREAQPLRQTSMAEKPRPTGRSKVKATKQAREEKAPGKFSPPPEYPPQPKVM
ncbi:MAG: hypothetical protein M0P73_18340 [Syntrophobacterales bacterium]|jgi:hypothetical protein|nr:hypothetical protein [Syntrophobacterales bacterium]